VRRSPRETEGQRKWKKENGKWVAARRELDAPERAGPLFDFPFSIF
jgi:hypothetical protein